MKPRTGRFELLSLNAYWLGLSFMWNSLHVLVLPAVILQYVVDSRKNTVLGLLTFAGLVLAMIIQPIAGGLSDRMNTRFGRRRPWITVGTFGDLLFLGLMAAAGGLPLLALAYIGLQFTSNIAHGPAQGMMHDRIPPERMGVASGMKNLFDMGGLVVSSLLVGSLLTEDTLGLTLAAIAAVLVLTAVITVFGVNEPSSGVHPLRPAQADPVRTGGSDRHFRRLILARLFFLAGVYGIQTFAQYFIRDTLAVPDPVKLTGDLLATIVLTLIGFSLVAGYLCDRLGRKPMHIAASMLLATGSLLMTTAQTSTAILIYGSVIGAGIGLFLSANWALASDLAPLGKGGKYLGLTNIATAGAGALSRLAGPGIDALNNVRPGEHMGYTALFVLAAALSLTSLGFLSAIPEHLRTARIE
ncbi:MAG: MFS transporter [Anaerolineales bacterium]|nr:MFS transporter [Anaerolineales bacterium]